MLHTYDPALHLAIAPPRLHATAHQTARSV
jgi:hypothetical protein